MTDSLCIQDSKHFLHILLGISDINLTMQAENDAVGQELQKQLEAAGVYPLMLFKFFIRSIYVPHFESEMQSDLKKKKK